MIYHTPIMAAEIVNFFTPCSGGVFVDATCGEGGHSEVIVSHLSYKRLICIDRDATILSVARERLARFPGVSFHHAAFDRLPEILRAENLDGCDAILADLGVSMYHFILHEGTKGRGLSIHDDEGLDMRLDRSTGITAQEVVNTFSQEEIADILYTYGEEYDAYRIARAICQNRPIRSAAHLSRVVLKAKRSQGYHKIHPATKTFQALRIFLNKELEILESFLPLAADNLHIGGRLAVISFHSLEDRIVKRSFQSLAKEGKVKILTPKPVVPSHEEIMRNKASRSAKLRVVERMAV
ncbi:16S rRNA (cytosine(1402)-N(4))-methyltransferase RsmH [Thermospira aquatica]|uniref:Ribosomal RNA small subunit methyltransferase H n=1 Tax=Thermospira aquatica TaxID=2828656 RepID=A0AAX3BDV5_9SPIR|nr:16S rRNA (cytosine(1402)-N(4))-methyltransferase RsmH [Thermospira aquatica]URA10285.1 16S rRNA (cytosine(1402)-N(4))-methyltransferase RsmH [Thermospira aquatica]